MISIRTSGGLHQLHAAGVERGGDGLRDRHWTDAFKGLIRGFYGDGTFYRSFAEKGAPDCGTQPTRRF